jgi:DNA repair protein RadC
MSTSLRLKDQPASERPRERLAARGAEALSHAELIAILLRTGLKGTNVVEVGRQLLVLRLMTCAAFPASGATRR